MGDSDKKCFPRRSSALPVPRSTNSANETLAHYDGYASISIPCKNNGKKAMKNTKKMEMMERLIQSKTGMRW